MRLPTVRFTMQHGSLLRVLAYAGSVMSCSLLPQVALDDSGTFEAVFSTVNNLHLIDRGDGNSIVGGASIGTFTVVKGSGNPFAEGSVGQAECIPLIKKGPNSIDLEAHCTFTSSPDDKLFGLFKRKSGDIAAGTGGQGRLELLGGTGKYSGITGACPYKTSYMPQNTVVTIARCDWNK